MSLSRTGFFLLISILFITPFFMTNLVWFLQSKKTQGFYSFNGMGNALQGAGLRPTYSNLYFYYNNKQIWLHGPGNIQLPEGTPVSIRYQVDNPNDAKADTLIGLWGNTIIYGGIILLLLSVVIIPATVIPRGNKIFLHYKKPFIRLIENDKS